MNCFLLLLALLAVPAWSAAEKDVDALFRPVADGKMPGAAVAVIQNGKVVLMKAYGLADVASATPNTTKTIFRLASVTKPFTAIAILQLAEAGKLKLDDPVSKHLPEAPHASEVRISHLLSHTAGIPDFVPMEEVRRRPLEFEPGSRINYSNNGYALLGQLIEKVAGIPWDQYLREHVFAPLEMQTTGWDRTEQLPGRATPYVLNKDGAYETVTVQDAVGAGAGGGLYSTVEDLARWAAALESGTLLRKETLDRATRPNILTDGRRTAYGYGWMTRDFRGLREAGHGGDITGFNTYVARYPDERFTVIVLSNIGMRPPGPLPDAGELAHRIAALWLGDRMSPEGVRPSFKVPAATLDRYAGTYKLDAPEVIIRNMGALITITRDGARLMAEVNGMKLPIDAKSETVFQAAGSPAELTFMPGANAKCPSLVVTLMGLREFNAIRTE